MLKASVAILTVGSGRFFIFNNLTDAVNNKYRKARPEEEK
jgi:hypothetical protein